MQAPLVTTGWLPSQHQEGYPHPLSTALVETWVESLHSHARCKVGPKNWAESPHVVNPPGRRECLHPRFSSTRFPSSLHSLQFSFLLSAPSQEADPEAGFGFKEDQIPKKIWERGAPQSGPQGCPPSAREGCCQSWTTSGLVGSVWTRNLPPFILTLGQKLADSKRRVNLQLRGNQCDDEENDPTRKRASRKKASRGDL